MLLLICFIFGLIDSKIQNGFLSHHIVKRTINQAVSVVHIRDHEIAVFGHPYIPVRNVSFGIKCLKLVRVETIIKSWSERMLGRIRINQAMDNMRILWL